MVMTAEMLRLHEKLKKARGTEWLSPEGNAAAERVVRELGESVDRASANVDGSTGSTHG
jgi:hypothetical protein